MTTGALVVAAYGITCTHFSTSPERRCCASRAHEPLAPVTYFPRSLQERVRLPKCWSCTAASFRLESCGRYGPFAPNDPQVLSGSGSTPWVTALTPMTTDTDLLALTSSHSCSAAGLQS